MSDTPTRTHSFAAVFKTVKGIQHLSIDRSIHLQATGTLWELYKKQSSAISGAKRKMTQVRWAKLFFKTAVWLSAEIALTFLGLDNLADYSEFLFQNQRELPVFEASIGLVASTKYSSACLLDWGN